MRMVCMYCRTIYQDGPEETTSHGICPECNAEIEAVSDEELEAKMDELKERYKERRK